MTVVKITYYEAKCLGAPVVKKNEDGINVVTDRHTEDVYVPGLGNCVVGQTYTLDHWQAAYYGAAFNMDKAKSETKDVKLDDETIDQKNESAPAEPPKPQAILDDDGNELTEEEAKEFKLRAEAKLRGFKGSPKGTAVEAMQKFDEERRAKREGRTLDEPVKKPEDERQEAKDKDKKAKQDKEKKEAEETPSAEEQGAAGEEKEEAEDPKKKPTKKSTK